MEFLKIEYVKQHSRIDYDCEDSLLELYANSAEENIAGILNRGKTVGQMVESLTEEYGAIPSAIYQAALMLVDISYQHRSPVESYNMSLVPYSFDLLIKPYIRL
jgi:uncharacterized phage protein (predicted DNA packaging)